ncbi:MAG: DDE-type integrase/transposase/recombinase [Nitrososphaerota archaeon]
MDWSHRLRSVFKPERRRRRMVAMDETVEKVSGQTVYLWSEVDVDSKKLLALEASYGRNSLNAFRFLRKALKLCLNKPKIIVGSGPWYGWAIQRLGLDYGCQRFGMRSRVERFFRYLKERTAVFHNKLS